MNNSTKSIYTHVRVTLTMVMLIVCGCFGAVIYVGETGFERLSLHAWLKSEAKRVSIETLQGNDEYLPDQNVFDFYIQPNEDIPQWLEDYNTVGLYEILLGAEDKHFIVSQLPNSQHFFYVVFRDDADDFLDEYEDELYLRTLVVAAAATIFIILYCYLLSVWLSKPLRTLQSQAKSVTNRDKPLQVKTEYKELQEIEHNLIQSQHSINTFIQRENEFHRFASHELRTPIAVISGSVELLQDVHFDSQSRVGQRAIHRMENATAEMQWLTDALLLLGKETIEKERYEHCDIAEIIQLRVEQLTALFRQQNVEVNIESLESLIISSPKSFLIILMSNLLKNAFSYGEKQIDISINSVGLQIVNQHKLNKENYAGYGVGLVIVERICQKMGWIISIENNETHFFTRIEFNQD